MTPFPGILLGLVVATILSVCVFGIVIARVVAGPFLSRRGRKPDLGPIGCLVGVVTIPLCFIVGVLANALCLALMDVPSMRIEPASFSGGPSEPQALVALSLAASIQTLLAVCIWLVTFYLTSSPKPAGTDPGNNGG